MNIFLTIVWFIIATIGSFLFAHYMMTDSILLVTLMGFISSVIVRFMPMIFCAVLVECL